MGLNPSFFLNKKTLIIAPIVVFALIFLYPILLLIGSTVSSSIYYEEIQKQIPIIENHEITQAFKKKHSDILHSISTQGQVFQNNYSITFSVVNYDQNWIEQLQFVLHDDNIKQINIFCLLVEDLTVESTFTIQTMEDVENIDCKS